MIVTNFHNCVLAAFIPYCVMKLIGFKFPYNRIAFWRPLTLRKNLTSRPSLELKDIPPSSTLLTANSSMTLSPGTNQRLLTS